MENQDDIYIRLLKIEDTEAVLSLETRNKDFFKHYTVLREPNFYTFEKIKERIENGIAGAKNDTLYAFGIFLISTDELIGNVALSHISRGPAQSGMIGYCLDKTHNGKGYMTKAVKLAVEYGFKTLKLHRIEAGVMPHHIPSITVLEKAGFHKEGIAKENVQINGKWQDHLILAIINQED
ncbi:MAG: GNAT family protein [Psychrobacillus psychrodurans]